MNIFYWILIILGGALGIAMNLYLFLSMPAVIGWKIYRKVKYKISIFD